MSWNNISRDEIFTPYSRIPPIGSKNKNFKNFTERKSVEVGMMHSALPIRKRKLPQKDKDPENEKLLIRRKTYIVLEPIVLKGKKSQ